jgi:hypothetical protein
MAPKSTATSRGCGIFCHAGRQDRAEALCPKPRRKLLENLQRPALLSETGESLPLKQPALL